jgi:hypothetical protein
MAFEQKKIEENEWFLIFMFFNLRFQLAGIWGFRWSNYVYAF